VDRGGGVAAVCGALVLGAVEQTARGGGVRRLCGGTVPEVLRADDGAAEPGAGDVLPAAADRVLRGVGLGARDGVAGGGLPRAAAVSADRTGGSAAGSLDDLADAAADRRGDAPGGIYLGAGGAGEEGIAAGEDAGRGRDDAGSECGVAEHRAAGQRGELPGVSDQASAGIGDRDADARRLGAAGPQAGEERIEPGVGESARPRGADHEEEGRADAPGAQGGARRGFGDRSGGGGDSARSRPRGHDNDQGNVYRGGRAGGGGGEGTGGGCEDECARAGRGGSGQGLSQWRDAGGLAGDRSAVVYLGAATGAATLAGQAEGTGGGLRESAAHPGREGQTTPAPTGRVLGENLCPCLRYGRDAADAPAGTSEHLKAAAGARGGIQPEPGSAPGSRSRDAAGPARPPEPPLFLLRDRLDDPPKPPRTLGSATGDFGGQISDSPASGSATERSLKNTISTTGC